MINMTEWILEIIEQELRIQHLQQVLQVSGIMQWNAITTYTITAAIVVTAVGDAAVAEESAV
jgi:CRISPR/Cas system endoribonuclease Cas6 (RAMP superfamily)